MTSLPRGIPKVANRKTMSILSGMTEVARSPKESPPTIKKKLCRLVNGGQTENVTNEYGIVLGDGNLNSNKHSSILKKTPMRGSPLFSRCASPASTRRVQFKQHVTVFLMSDDGDVICSECQKLRTESDSPVKPMPRTVKPFCNINNNNPIPFMGFHSGKCDLKNSDDVVDTSQMEFRFTEEAERGTILKFVVPLGHEYKPDDIVVKANVSGSRIRLVANRPVSYPDGSMRMEQLSKRFMLPMDVDPYLVTARLDIKGNLTVEAPLLTLAKRESTKKAPAVLQDISNKHMK